MLARILFFAVSAMAVDEIDTEEVVQKPQVVTSSTAYKVTDGPAGKLTPEEMAFAAKLSDENRKIFIEKFTSKQRRTALAAVQEEVGALSADDAVEISSEALSDEKVCQSEMLIDFPESELTDEE